MAPRRIITLIHLPHCSGDSDLRLSFSEVDVKERKEIARKWLGFMHVMTLSGGWTVDELTFNLNVHNELNLPLSWCIIWHQCLFIKTTYAVMPDWISLIELGKKTFVGKLVDTISADLWSFWTVKKYWTPVIYATKIISKCLSTLLLSLNKCLFFIIRSVKTCSVLFTLTGLPYPPWLAILIILFVKFKSLY